MQCALDIEPQQFCIENLDLFFCAGSCTEFPQHIVCHSLDTGTDKPVLGDVLQGGITDKGRDGRHLPHVQRMPKQVAAGRNGGIIRHLCGIIRLTQGVRCFQPVPERDIRKLAVPDCQAAGWFVECGFSHRILSVLPLRLIYPFRLYLTASQRWLFESSMTGRISFVCLSVLYR